jgi:hypothetical protein
MFGWVDPVRRSADGRPYIIGPCPNAHPEPSEAIPSDHYCVEGRVPSAKREGKTVQCPKCKGVGWIETLYTRCTTFVSAMEESSALAAWKLRLVLTGVALDARNVSERRIIDELVEIDFDEPGEADLFTLTTKQQIDAIAEHAFEIADGHLKAKKGTTLHELSELVDRQEPLPPETTDQERADLGAYVRVVESLGLVMLESELFVVNDELKIAGTLDRLCGSKTEALCDQCELPVIVDLKTGRVDYGAGKIAQQLAVYSRSKRYDPVSGARSELGACPHKGIVIHLPQGTGEAEPLLVDLEAGYGGALMSRDVRQYRNASKKWLSPL